MKTLGMICVALVVAHDRASAQIDEALLPPTWIDMVGANEKQVLLEMSRGKDVHYGVVELGTSCVVETAPRFARVESLIGLGFPAAGDRRTPAERQLEAAKVLADPATQAEIREYVALHLRFGRHTDGHPSGDFAWSSDGSKIVTTAAEAFFRSRDGGKSYELVETNMSRKPLVTHDGRFAFVQRCGDSKIHNHSCLKAQEVAIVDMVGTNATRIVAVGDGTIEGLDPTGQKLVFIRDNEPLKLVVDHLDPATGTLANAFSIPAPPLEPNTFHTIDPSRNGRFGGFFTWISKRGDSKLMAKIAVVSMTDGRIVHTQKQPFVGTEVDDDGRLAWGTVNLVKSFATTPKGVIKNAGAGDRIGWAPGGRLVVFDAPKGKSEAVKLRDVACKIVRIVRVGS